jgi:hypothetical protein
LLGFFLASGGDTNWIVDPWNAPKKLLRLQTVNSFLAHQPWKLAPEHMATLLVADPDDASGEDTVWSLAELMQACALMTTFHSHCTLSYGLGCAADGIFPTDELPVAEIPPVLTDGDRAEVLEKLTEKQFRGAGPEADPEKVAEALEQFSDIRPVELPTSLRSPDIGSGSPDGPGGSPSPGTPEGEKDDKRAVLRTTSESSALSTEMKQDEKGKDPQAQRVGATASPRYYGDDRDNGALVGRRLVAGNGA